MSEKNQLPPKKLVATAAGIGLCFVAIKYRSLVFNKIKIIANYKNPIRNQDIRVIDTVHECRTVMKNIKSHCAEYNVLGFDCEWVVKEKSRQRVSLLQLTSHRGFCALIRLSHLQMIPRELIEILADENVLKVGVAPHGDAKYLANDYGIKVTNTLDLRYLAEMTACRPESLNKMAKQYLKVELNKDRRIVCSDWEATTLDEEQIEYAAKDAHVGLELFKFFVARLKRRRLLKKYFSYNENISGVNSLKSNSSETARLPTTTRWKFGIEFDRLVMLLCDVFQIQLLWDADPSILNQYKPSESVVVQKTTLSAEPVNWERTITFLLPENQDLNSFSSDQLCEFVFQEMLQQIDVVKNVYVFDTFFHPELKRMYLNLRVKCQVDKRCLEEKKKVNRIIDSVAVNAANNFNLTLRNLSKQSPSPVVREWDMTFMLSENQDLETFPSEQLCEFIHQHTGDFAKKVYVFHTFFHQKLNTFHITLRVEYKVDARADQIEAKKMLNIIHDEAKTQAMHKFNLKQRN